MAQQTTRPHAGCVLSTVKNTIYGVDADTSEAFLVGTMARVGHCARKIFLMRDHMLEYENLMHGSKEISLKVPCHISPGPRFTKTHSAPSNVILE